MARYSYSPYETRGEVIVDTRTGLSHDAGEAAKWQKQYRWLREWCGEKNPGVPLVISEAQIRDITEWRALERGCMDKVGAGRLGDPAVVSCLQEAFGPDSSCVPSWKRTFVGFLR